VSSIPLGAFHLIYRGRGKDFLKKQKHTTVLTKQEKKPKGRLRKNKKLDSLEEKNVLVILDFCLLRGNNLKIPIFLHKTCPFM
jgi:hypothetical protein